MFLKCNISLFLHRWCLWSGVSLYFSRLLILTNCVLLYSMRHCYDLNFKCYFVVFLSVLFNRWYVWTGSYLFIVPWVLGLSCSYLSFVLSVRYHCVRFCCIVLCIIISNFVHFLKIGGVTSRVSQAHQKGGGKGECGRGGHTPLAWHAPGEFVIGRRRDATRAAMHLRAVVV